MVSPAFQNVPSWLIGSSVAWLAACGSSAVDDAGGAGSGSTFAGASSFAGGPSFTAGSGNAGAAPLGNGGAPATGGTSNGNAGSTGATCAGVAEWTLGTSASSVSHGGKRYSCKVAGWCASTAPAYEPGVGFAWQDAWNDEGACGTGNNGAGGATGSAGSSNGAAGASSAGCVLDTLLTEATFQSWFPSRNGFYTYANMCTAMGKYPAFANTGDVTAEKREIAAFFANVARETGMLRYIDQISKDPANGNYWGRGPLQITWNYNYQACGAAIGADLIGNPSLVATDGAITWETALWFWMTNDGGKGKTPHQAIVGGSFGGTINAINGGLECNGPNEGANERIDHYQKFTQALGVDPGSNQTCW